MSPPTSLLLFWGVGGGGEEGRWEKGRERRKREESRELTFVALVQVDRLVEQQECRRVGVVGKERFDANELLRSEGRDGSNRRRRSRESWKLGRFPKEGARSRKGRWRVWSTEVDILWEFEQSSSEERRKGVLFAFVRSSRLRRCSRANTESFDFPHSRSMQFIRSSWILFPRSLTRTNSCPPNLLSRKSKGRRVFRPSSRLRRLRFPLFSSTASPRPFYPSPLLVDEHPRAQKEKSSSKRKPRQSGRRPSAVSFALLELKSTRCLAQQVCSLPFLPSNNRDDLVTPPTSFPFPLPIKRKRHDLCPTFRADTSSLLDALKLAHSWHSSRLHHRLPWTFPRGSQDRSSEKSWRA